MPTLQEKILKATKNIPSHIWKNETAMRLFLARETGLKVMVDTLDGHRFIAYFWSTDKNGKERLVYKRGPYFRWYLLAPAA